MRMIFNFFVLALAFGAAPAVRADARHFGYSTEADSILERGHWEFEQWVTHRSGRQDGVFRAFDLREELEFGLLERLTTALYLNFRDLHSEGVTGVTDRDAMEFKGVSSEWKYMVLSPHLHPLGLLLYFEPTYEGEELELEGKVVLQHNFGERWIGVVNAVAEPEWEFDPGGTAKELTLEFTAGLAYQPAPHWSAGIEARSHTEYVDWGDHEHDAVFVGPSLHWEGGRGWATLTALPQIPGSGGSRVLDVHEKVEVRLIGGVLF